jgi:hypothetical protein
VHPKPQHFFAIGHFDWPFTKNHDAFNIPEIKAFSNNMGLC